MMPGTQADRNTDRELHGSPVLPVVLPTMLDDRDPEDSRAPFLTAECWDAVFRVCHFQVRDWHAAQDLCQETFVRALLTRAVLKDPCRARAWILRIAVNLCLAYRRRKRLREFLGSLVPWLATEDSREPPDPAADPGEQAEGRERIRRVLAALHSLKERDRTLFSLVALGGLSAAEAASVTGITHEAARQALSRARRRLRDVLGGPADAVPPTPIGADRGPR